MSEQLPLDLPHAAGLDAADFVAAACNRAARALVEDWLDWPARAAAIWGPSGAGKSHLAAIWANGADATALDLAALVRLDLTQLDPPWRILFDLGSEPLPPAAETPLFHLLNTVRERAGALLIVARTAPARWSVALPDLGSRLRALPTAAAEAPDDETFKAVIAKQLADRQLVVDRQTLDYLAARAERSFATARSLAVRLDRAALAKRRRITIKLAGEVLAEMETDGGGAADGED